MHKQNPDKFYEAVFNAHPEPCLVLNTALEILAANEAYLAVTMTERSAILGRNAFEVFPGNPAAADKQGGEALRASMETAVHTGQPDSPPVSRYDIPRRGAGEGFEKRYWKPLNTPVLIGGEVAYLIHTVEDVTDKQQMELALEEQAELLDYANVFAVDARDRIVFWNSGSEKIFGYSRQEALGVSCPRLLRTRYPEPPEKIREILERSGEWSGEVTHFDKQGQAVTVWTHWLLHKRPVREGHAVVQVNSDISERKRLEEMLRRRTEELEIRDRGRNQFIAILSHELRNPLAAITHIAPLLRENCNGNPLVEQLAGMLERPVSHLNRLVDDLLDVARLTSGKIVLQTEVMELVFAVRRAVSIVRPEIDRRGQTLDLTLPGPAVWVQGDAIRLEQMVVNLLNNASRYTQEGGTIGLTVECRDGQVSIVVEDNGIGMDEKVLPKVFDLFSRGEHAPGQDGLGVGLALVKEIVRLHGGSVEASSYGHGRGSRLTVNLDTVESPRESVQGAGQCGRDLVRCRCILVVDDNKDAADSLAMLLELQGHDVHVAYNGQEGLQIAMEQQPDVVVLDLGMPAMDGYEVAEHLRQLMNMERVVLIALTGYGQDEDRRRTREAGFNYHLTKPVDFQNFVSLVKELPD